MPHELNNLAFCTEYALKIALAQTEAPASSKSDVFIALFLP